MAQLPITLDPRYATDAASQKVQAFIHRGLTRQDEHFLPQADVAERWQQTDPRTWDFFLRPNIRFHNGQALTASDVAATLNSIMDATRASPLRAGFASIASIEVLAPLHLRLHLSEPDASLLTRLNVGILPQSIAALPQQQKGIVGCGSCAWVSGDNHQITVRRIAKADHGQAQRFRFIHVKDAVTRSLKLARGEIDLMQNDFPLHMLNYLQQQAGITVATTPSTTFAYIGMNMQDAILSDVRVRHALALGVNRSALKKALLQDKPILAETVLTPSHWAAATLAHTPADIAAANALLDSAGYTRGEDGWRFHLTYRTSTNPERLLLATAIAAGWRDIGVDVAIESLEWGAFYARIKRGDFQLFSLSWVGISDPDIYRWILHSDMWPPKGANRGRYATPQVDDWLQQAMHASSQDERVNLYQQIQQQMQRDYVYIPLWFEPVVAVSGPRLHGFKPSVDGALTPVLQAQLK
jgi:peptide/nickel transport system substrate-binding protein